MLYSGGRRLAAPLLERTDDEIVAAYLADLAAVFPGADAVVEEALVQRWPRALPYPAPGRAALQPALTRPLGPIHLAGDYLGSFYTDTAIRTGVEAAQRIRTLLEAVRG
jgi:oxygen-dependent protoporphyrinogen oxidase